MKKYKKILIDAILFFVIIGLTLYGVFHGEDLSGLKDAIKESNILWLIPAVPLVLFFIAGESIVIWHMLDCYGIYVKERLCFLFSAVGFFFSCVTPSATGGQPMQIYFMKMEEKRQQETDEKRKYYQGLPITSIAVILPFLYAISNLCQDNFEIVLSLAMLLTGLLFVLNFKFPKPNNKQLTVLIIVVAAVVLYLLFCFNWKEYYGWNLSDLMFWKHKKG